MKSVSIIIPCYNYEKLVIKKVKKLIKKIKSHKIKYEFIIVDDCSKDGTFKKLKENFFSNKNILVVKNSVNRGKSYSIRKGIKISKYNHIILIDCDLTYFEKIDHIIKLMKKDVDFIAVNRRLKASRLTNKTFSLYQLIRHFIGQFISQIIKNLLKLKIEACDTQAGLKGFKKIPILKRTKFISNRFFFDLELFFLFINQNRKVEFIPVKYEISKDSSIKIFDIKNFLIIVELYKVILKCRNLK